MPRLPSERDKHVLERAAVSWEDVERYQGRFLDIWQIETWVVRGLLYKRRHPFDEKTYATTRFIIYSAARAAVRASVVPPSAMQRIEGERCLRTNAGDLKVCTGAGDQVSGKRTRDRSSLLPLLRLRPHLHRLYLHRPRLPTVTNLACVAL
jgi:hypothetical protein